MQARIKINYLNAAFCPLIGARAPPYPLDSAFQATFELEGRLLQLCNPLPLEDTCIFVPFATCRKGYVPSTAQQQMWQLDNVTLFRDTRLLSVV